MAQHYQLCCCLHRINPGIAINCSMDFHSPADELVEPCGGRHRVVDDLFHWRIQGDGSGCLSAPLRVQFRNYSLLNLTQSQLAPARHKHQVQCCSGAREKRKNVIAMRVQSVSDTKQLHVKGCPRMCVHVLRGRVCSFQTAHEYTALLSVRVVVNHTIRSSYRCLS